MKISASLFASIIFLVCTYTSASFCMESQNNIIIGLDADMSSGSAKSGISIKRGIEIAMDEINSQGGVMGKQLKLIIKDHRGNPARGIDNIKEFSKIKNLAAVIGGLHTPVAMAELKTIHEKKIIYLVPWAAGTPVIKNKYSPNFAFRVSVRDEYAGGFLIGKALEKGYTKPVLLLEQTGWGRSNEKSMTAALKKQGLSPAAVLWFNWGENDMSHFIEYALKKKGDVIMLTANSPEGATFVKAMADLPEKKRLPIISHWGITGGNFFKNTKDSIKKIDLKFLQTYSFINPVFKDLNKKIVDAYTKKYKDADSAIDIFSPVGTAHAYDIVHLLKLAIEKVDTIKSSAVRKSMEHLPQYNGLVKIYNPAFTPENHDALTIEDFTLAGFNQFGNIVPVTD